VEQDENGNTWWPISVPARRIDASSAEQGRKPKEGESAEVAEARDDIKKKISRVDGVRPRARD
jgi:hypothetical protein